jgi:outer membrane protein OmpA-like peptidoglycan-associated protein
MKKTVTLFCTIVLSAFVFSVNAQEQQEQFEQKRFDKYGNNWFISLGGNANLLVAEQDKELGFGDRLTFGGAFAVGKWFNPYFGARINVMYGELKGFNFRENRGGEFKLRYTQPHDLPRIENPIGTGPNGNDWSKFKLEGDGFIQQFKYGTAGVDIMANLTNLFRGTYRERNVIDVVPYLGLGYIRAFNNDLTTINCNSVYARLGMMVSCNINDDWAVFLDPQATITPNEFDGYVGDSPFDAIANLTLGVQYTINRDYSVPTASLLSKEEIDYINQRINDNRALIDNHQDILDRQQGRLDELGECCQDNQGQEIVAAPQPGDRFLPQYVRFALDSSVIQDSEIDKISEAIEFIKANPSAKLQLIGYADKLTGNKRYNLSLSKKRVNTVVDIFERAGISADRLYADWRGDTEQPYTYNEWNRVVIIVQR